MSDISGSDCNCAQAERDYSAMREGRARERNARRALSKWADKNLPHAVGCSLRRGGVCDCVCNQQKRRALERIIRSLST